MYILTQFLIAIIFIVIIIIWYRDEYTWWEYILQALVPIFLALIINAISTTTRENDTEYWGNTIVKVAYQEEYEEYDPCKETYDCNCTTDDDGNTSCDTCCRGGCVDYGPYWFIYNERGTERSVSKNKYRNIINHWSTQVHTKEDYKGDHCGKGDYHYAKWPKTRETYKIYATQHTYKNKVRYNKVYVPDQLITRNAQHTFEYPNIREFEQDHILGDYWTGSNDRAEAELNLDIHAGLMGPRPQEQHGQIKPFLLLFKDASKDAASAQFARWQGGNKNEYTVMIGWNSKTNKITWYDIMTFTENGACKNRMKEYLHENREASLEEITQKMRFVLNQHWERRSFTPINQLIKLKPTKGVWITAILLGIILGIVFMIAFSRNEHK